MKTHHKDNQGIKITLDFPRFSKKTILIVAGFVVIGFLAIFWGLKSGGGIPIFQKHQTEKLLKSAEPAAQIPIPGQEPTVFSGQPNKPYEPPFIYIIEGAITEIKSESISGNFRVESKDRNNIGDLIIGASLYSAKEAPAYRRLYSFEIIGESFSLRAGESKNLNFSIKTPRTLPGGIYTVNLQVFLKGPGLGLGFRDLTSDILAGAGGPFLLSDPASRKLTASDQTKTRSYKTTISQNDPEPLITGMVQNAGSDAEFIPRWTIRDYNSFGTLLKEGSEAPVLVKSGSSYNFEYKIPFAGAGKRQVALWFESKDGVKSSDLLNFLYVGEGISGKILTAYLDKTSYSYGEAASVSIRYLGSASGISTSEERRMALQIFNGAGRLCSEKAIILPKSSGGEISEILPIKRRCLDPVLKLEYWAGETRLDRAQFAFESRNEDGTPLTEKTPKIVYWLGGVLLVLMFGAFMFKKLKGLAFLKVFLWILLAGSCLAILLPGTALGHVVSKTSDVNPAPVLHTYSYPLTPPAGDPPIGDFSFGLTSSVAGATNYRMATLLVQKNSTTSQSCTATWNHVDSTTKDINFQVALSSSPNCTGFGSDSWQLIAQIIAEDASKPLAFSKTVYQTCYYSPSVYCEVPISNPFNHSVSLTQPAADATLLSGSKITISGTVLDVASSWGIVSATIFAYLEQGVNSYYLGNGKFTINSNLADSFSFSFETTNAIPAGWTVGAATLRLHTVLYYDPPIWSLGLGSPAPIRDHTKTVNVNYANPPLPQPDLISQFVSMNGTPTAGQTLTFTANVKNQGTANAGVSTIRFCLDSPSCGLATFSVALINAGQTSANITSGDFAPTADPHTLHACADAGEAIAESNETNNCVPYGFTVVPAGAFDYSFSTLPTNVSVIQGSSVNNTLNLNLVSGATQSVTLSATGGPAGTTFSFGGGASCSPTCAKTLTITTLATAPIGSYTITVTGTSTGLPNKTTTFTLTVNSPGVFDYSMSFSNPSLSVIQGDPVYNFITATLISGTPGPVTFSFGGSLPPGSTAFFDPVYGNTCTPNPTCLVLPGIDTGPSTPLSPPDYTITVNGNPGSKSASYNLSVIPLPPVPINVADFISQSVPSTMAAGETKTATLTFRNCRTNGNCGYDSTTNTSPLAWLKGRSEYLYFTVEDDYAFLSESDIYYFSSGGLYHWNGNTSSAVNSVSPPGTSGVGIAMQYKSPTEIYVLDNRNPRNQIWQWDGLGWIQTPWDNNIDFNPNLFFSIFKPISSFYVASPSEVYAIIGTKFHQWNGSGWTKLSENEFWGSTKLFYFSPSEIYLHDSTTAKISRWNGTTIEQVTSGVRGKPQIISANEVYGLVLDNTNWEYAPSVWDGNAWIKIPDSGYCSWSNCLGLHYDAGLPNHPPVTYLFFDGSYVQKSAPYHLSVLQPTPDELTYWKAITADLNSEVGDLKINSESDIYALSNSGTKIQRWNGLNWTNITSTKPFLESSFWNTLQVNSLTEIYVAGRMTDKIWKWDGGSWTSIVAAESLKDFRTFYVVSPTDIYAIFNDRKLYHWNGGAWTNLDSSINLSYSNQIHYFSPSEIYVGGEDNRVYQWNGSLLIPISTAGNNIKNGGRIKTKSANEIYATTQGFYTKWNGSGWSNESVSLSQMYHAAELSGEKYTTANGIVYKFAQRSVGPILSSGGYSMLPSNYAVPGNADVVFSIPITAPMTPGDYHFKFQLFDDFFGESSPFTIITVTPPPPCDTSFLPNQFHACYFDGTLAPLTPDIPLNQGDESVVPSPVGTWAGFDHNWLAGEVDNSAKSDQVSGVWRANATFQDGYYVFHVITNDGAELNLSGTDSSGTPLGNVISGTWTDKAADTQVDSAAYHLLAGAKDITLRWYENSGDARIKLWWDFDAPPGVTPEAPTGGGISTPADLTNLTGNAGSAAFGEWPPGVAALPLRPTFTWSTNEPQTAYQIQIDNNSSFSSPEYDSTKQISISTSHIVPTINPFDLSSYPTQCAGTISPLSCGTIYYWRVKVWDSVNLESSWANGQNFSTQTNRAPTVTATWNPNNPTAQQLVNFTDTSTPYGGTTKTAWAWTFQDGNPSSATLQDPAARFQTTGSKSFTLIITDSNNISNGNNTMSLGVGSGLPPLLKWLETFGF